MADIGGAERVRTAASQFCRLLPYHLGTAPQEGVIIVGSFSGTQHKTALSRSDTPVLGHYAIYGPLNEKCNDASALSAGLHFTDGTRGP